MHETTFTFNLDDNNNNIGKMGAGVRKTEVRKVEVRSTKVRSTEVRKTEVQSTEIQSMEVEWEQEDKHTDLRKKNLNSDQ